MAPNNESRVLLNSSRACFESDAGGGPEGRGGVGGVGTGQRMRSMPRRLSRMSRASMSTAMTPHRDGGDPDDPEEEEEKRKKTAVVPYSTPEGGFRGYTYEVAEALKDIRREQREVQGGLIGPMRAIAELQRVQEQRNEAFRLWLSDVMKREREIAKRAAFTVLKRRDQMLQEAGPDWFQQLSWPQMETVNELQAVHRADSEESRTGRVELWCCKLGVTPIPSARQITRALRQEPENHEGFLFALYAVISKSGKVPTPGDPPAPKLRTGFEYTPSERLLLSALAHLRLPDIIGKLEEEFGPPEKQPRYLRINPEMPAVTARSERYLWPYLEPLPVPREDWLEVHNANHTAHVENLYMRAHKLPPTLIKELLPKPQLRVTIPEMSNPMVQRRKRKLTKSIQSEDLPTGVPPAASPDAGENSTKAPSRSAARRRGGRWRSAARTASATRSIASSPMRAPASAKNSSKLSAKDDPVPPGVEAASVMAFLESMASEEPLCQLPDVQKIPAIQKWVRLRNGLLYIHRKLDEVLQDRSLIMWNANHLGMAYRVPSPRHGLTPKQGRELTWDRKDWYRRRVAKIMKGYYTALRCIQVNASREMFPAMACDYFPNRDKFLRTYFAYMPQHEMDSIVVKPWNRGECNKAILATWRDKYYQCKGKN